MKTFSNPSPLYRSDDEHDNCGVGFIANLHGTPSYATLDRAITGLKNLAHRGAIDADRVTGDGAGVLTQIPTAIFKDHLASIGKTLFDDRDLGVLVVFLPLEDTYQQAFGKRIIEDAIKREKLNFLAWRETPVDPTCLGQKAENTRPLILQALFAREHDLTDDEFERRCFLVMKTSESRAYKEKLDDFYIVSSSSRTITYKGLLNAPQVRKFYTDLKDPRFVTAFALFHQRFATNTLPDWTKAQPFRMMAHNGEINTIRGNRNLMRAREYASSHGVWGNRFADLRPVIQPDMSDSASFDNALQLINVSGRNCLHGVAMMMPNAWEKDTLMPLEVRDFYHFHSMIMEPWDGPSAIVYTDGRFVGASLDRNGLRPLRYKLYEDGTVIIASEAGLIPEWGSPIVKNARLGPGRMVAVDIEKKRLLEDEDIKNHLGSQADYGQRIAEAVTDLHELAEKKADFAKRTVPAEELTARQLAFGYDTDEKELILTPMMESGMEPIGSMGDDTPMAVLSRRPKLLYSYFKQLFAQVTNPAIDPIRENLVMSLNLYLGGRIGLYDEDCQDRRFLETESPVLFDHEFAEVIGFEPFQGKIAYLDAVFSLRRGPERLEKKIKELAAAAKAAVKKDGARMIIISDRKTDATHAPVPMLLAVGAIHQALVNEGCRLETGIITETAEARDVHQIACLLGFGATAVYPYLALDTLRDILDNGKSENLPVDQALKNYRKAIDKGLLKIMSKMGISTLFSYQAAQVFEAIGLSQSLIDECFYGTPSPIGGIGYLQIAQEIIRRHETAFPEAATDTVVTLGSEGYYTVNKKGDGEFHGWNPKVVSGMNKFIRAGGSFEDFTPYKEASDDHPPVSFKDLLKLRYASTPADLAKVEPIEDIRKRFTTAGMSLGALSPEAHETLAIAMNSIGGKSNSGEGGEDPRRFHPFDNGDNANSAIKQVASGRFGVTAEYLANAKEIEIKISQGAKPGEGGQLPGHKVSPLIAQLRYSVPGVMLISPPPHHDIYSIEDLAQLIYDLKEVNPRAKICVKLVSCSGVGTVAAGVAKAYADVILISGHEGGTGASPISSIKNAGSAWEIGLAEAHQVLLMNDLRNRVVLRTDGGMKTGRDIIIAALLGAEEFNFGTAALIASGCAMFRVCHLNTCPVGVATQREDLRAKFRGKPENVVNYFNAVAEDVRHYLAKLGHERLDDIIGHTEYLEQIDDPSNSKTAMINLAGLLHNPDPKGDRDRIHTRERNDSPGHEQSLDDVILQDARDFITKKKPGFKATYKVRNIHRNIGTRLSGEIAYHQGNNGLSHGTLDLTFKGSAGQSFGTFLVSGVTLRLIGEANDYVGKGMHAGEIIIRPREEESFVWKDNIIMGNTCLYGATGGYLFAAGCGGERFGVRNSGATAVVEGLGDHGCEYMTRGTVVSLGPVGRNFAAGMSGGLAFVYDSDNTLETRYNPEMVDLLRLDNASEIDSLKALITRHHEATGSPHAKALLDDWSGSLKQFWRVTPKSASQDTPGPVFSYSPEATLAPR
jgi:glutamate synthase (ferredoxin)